MTENRILAHSLTAKERSKDVLLTENVSFASLILPVEVLKGLSASGFEKPSPIQVRALPVGRCGFDLIVKSKSGTGKTLIFAIISLESIKLKKCQPQVLILAPTREIAVQIQDVIQNIGRFYEGLKVECFIGGLPVAMDQTKCQSCHIAVGTPGRVKQLIQDGWLQLNSVKIFVLDEADKLTEDSFQNDINEIYNSLPDHKQLIMCSATYTDTLQTCLKQYMCSPVLVSVELETPLLLGLRQYVRLMEMASPNVVQQTKAKNEELLKIIAAVPFMQCLVFSNFQSRAESISNFLNRNGWSSIILSAAQSQNERLKSLASLKEFKCRILVTTDLAARGIDAPNIDLVVNYDMPVDATTYLHRMGRAGRYGSTGNCVNLTFRGLESHLLQNILFYIGGQNISIPIMDDSYCLDLNRIPEENYLFAKASEDVQNDFREKIKEIRSSIAEHSKKKGKKNKKIKIKDAKEEKNVSLQGDAGADESNSDEFVKKTANLLDSKPSTAQEKDTGTMDASLLLQQLAERGELEEVKATNSSNDLSGEETFCKNKALFSVAKVLSNIEVSNEDCHDLSAYFSTLKSQENVTPSKKDPDLLENIFHLAYKSQVSKNNVKWQNLLPEEDKWKLDEVVDFEEGTSETYVEDTEVTDKEYYDKYYDFEVEKTIEVNFDQATNDYKFMEWVPVEPKPKPAAAKNVQTVALNSNNSTVATALHEHQPPERYHEEYSRYFDHCSNNLWQNGLTFESIEKFDHWFYHDWEKQLDAVRDFVQNKLYLEEMSKNY